MKLLINLIFKDFKAVLGNFNFATDLFGLALASTAI